MFRFKSCKNAVFFLIDSGSEFQTVGPKTEKDLFPSCSEISCFGFNFSINSFDFAFNLSILVLTFPLNLSILVLTFRFWFWF